MSGTLTQPALPARVLFGSIAVVIACETVFSAVVPTLLSVRIRAESTLVGLVVGVALGLGLAAIPVAVPWVRRGRSSSVLLASGVLLLTAGPLCVLSPTLPVVVTLSAALAFGAARAVAMLALLADVGRLGPDSRGHGHNGAAQRIGSAVGAVLAAVVLASGLDVAGTVLLASGGAAVLVLARMRPRERAERAVGGPRTVTRMAVLLRRDRWVRAALLVNVVVWVCVFVGNTMVPVGLVQAGGSARDSGLAVLYVLLVRDVVAALVGLLGWTVLRRLALEKLVVGVGIAAAIAAAVIVVSGFALVGLLLSGALFGCCIALGIACSNVIATSAGGDELELRLAASQSAAGLPIALAAVALVSLSQAVGSAGALAASAVLVMLVAGGAALSLTRSNVARYGCRS